MNKIDLIPKEDKDKIVTLAEKFYNLCYFKKCFFISALKGTGIQNLKKYFKKQVYIFLLLDLFIYLLMIMIMMLIFFIK